ncbi:[NiFe]-hydrogenase assembly chaperone HybE [Komagataeibacter kakiaceti JCM 25156]
MTDVFHGFEGSYLGNAERLRPDSIMECKICWSVYDPAQGCATWQIPPGTPFADLPDHWRCPTCDGAREQFMVVPPAVAAPPGMPDATRPTTPVSPMAEQEGTGSPPESDEADGPARSMEAAFREIHRGQMRGIPLLNEVLGVRAVGFRPYGGHFLGILITPWFMNLILAPGMADDWSGLVSGDKELIEFPSGRYEFTIVNRAARADMPWLPPYKACSLFSPVFEFTTMLQAVETARAALAALLDPTANPDHEPEAPAPPPEPVAAAPAMPSRRGLLFGAARSRGGA